MGHCPKTHFYRVPRGMDNGFLAEQYLLQPVPVAAVYHSRYTNGWGICRWEINDGGTISNTRFLLVYRNKKNGLNEEQK